MFISAVASPVRGTNDLNFEFPIHILEMTTSSCPLRFKLYGLLKQTSHVIQIHGTICTLQSLGTH